MSSQSIYSILFIILMLPGILGVIMMLPGIAYIFALALLYTIIDRFTNISISEISILAIGTFISFAIDQTAGFMGAYWSGARGRTFIFATIGAILGIFSFPPLGGFIGLAIGLFIGEIYRRRHHERYILSSIKTTIGGVLGVVAGITINTIIAIIMIVLFAIFVFI